MSAYAISANCAVPTKIQVATASAARTGRVARLPVPSRPSFAPLSLGMPCMKAVRRTSLKVRAIAVPAEPPKEQTIEMPVWPMELSGLRGKALQPPAKYPSRAEVFAAIPEHCYKKDTAKSMMYAVISVALTLGAGAVGYFLLPLKASWALAWLAYGAVTGTIATGCWVVAHECGHGAFSDNKFLQDLVGYVLHTALLVPYFSWQRSHAVHHSRTNHLSEGETHVPYKEGEKSGENNLAPREAVGETNFSLVQLAFHLVFGWPAYLLTGATGGPKYGVTNHSWPYKPFSGKLFPGAWAGKVVWSAIGVAAMLGFVGWWASVDGVLKVAAVYALPLVFTNVWLVLYTWLQHTDTDVPHYDNKDWDWVKGAFLTIDRPYGPVLDFLHHRIGSTHVAHHVSHTIPHYNAVEATQALQKAFPELYLYDPTPIMPALWRVASKCVAVRPFKDGMWVFTSRKNNNVPQTA